MQPWYGCYTSVRYIKYKRVIISSRGMMFAWGEGTIVHECHQSICIYRICEKQNERLPYSNLACFIFCIYILMCRNRYMLVTLFKRLRKSEIKPIGCSHLWCVKLFPPWKCFSLRKQRSQHNINNRINRIRFHHLLVYILNQNLFIRKLSAHLEIYLHKENEK